jgi:hypothetical protein
MHDYLPQATPSNIIWVIEWFWRGLLGLQIFFTILRSARGLTANRSIVLNDVRVVNCEGRKRAEKGRKWRGEEARPRRPQKFTLRFL